MPSDNASGRGTPSFYQKFASFGTSLASLFTQSAKKRKREDSALCERADADAAGEHLSHQPQHSAIVREEILITETAAAFGGMSKENKPPDRLQEAKELYKFPYQEYKAMHRISGGGAAPAPAPSAVPAPAQQVTLPFGNAGGHLSFPQLLAQPPDSTVKQLQFERRAQSPGRASQLRPVAQQQQQQQLRLPPAFRASNSYTTYGSHSTASTTAGRPHMVSALGCTFHLPSLP